MTEVTILITDRWRLSEDGDVQWILQQRRGEQWHSRAYCGTKTGLSEVALPHNKVAAPMAVLMALSQLPDSYEPGALEQVAIKRLIDIPHWQMRPDLFPAPETQEAVE